MFGLDLDLSGVAVHCSDSLFDTAGRHEEISSDSGSDVDAVVEEFVELGDGPSLAELSPRERMNATASIAAQKAREFDEAAWRKSWDKKPNVYTITIDLDEQEKTGKLFRLQVQYQGIKDRGTLQRLTESDTTKKYLKAQLQFIKGEADKCKTSKNAVQVARFVQDIDVTLRSLNR